MTDLLLAQLEPFGLVLTAAHCGTDLKVVSQSNLATWIDEHRVVVLRGFAALQGNEFPEFCAQFGDILEWDFGAVNSLQVQTDARNYLYTNRTVPFHWDGAFAGRVPHYIFFHCDHAPGKGSGGETLFSDTVRLLAKTTSVQHELWRQVHIKYTTEKIMHYGGTFTSALICEHPTTGQEVLRFAEPVADLNPVLLEIAGIPREGHESFLQDMHVRLNDDAVCYRHEWQPGDVVIADNFVLLHGRTAFVDGAPRSIRRVNIL